MAESTSLPPSRLGTDRDRARDPDHLPLSGCLRRPIGPSVQRAEGGPARDRREARADAGDADGAGHQQQVGEDLTEGEVQVLEEYGWIRNCGLGTMLNYRDRVVHDRWTEKSVADWRMKIGKLLMAGYAEGQTITTHLPKKLGDLLEDTGDIEIDIKLEDPF